MNDASRITLLQEIIAGLIEGGHIAPLPEGAGDEVPLRLTVRPDGASTVAAAHTAAGSRSQRGRAR
jgi:hypothetical protein